MKYHFSIYIIASAFSVFTAWFSFKKGSVNRSGLAAMVLISQTLIWWDLISLLTVLFYMFASSSVLSAVQKKYEKENIGVLSKTGARDYLQALANLGIAFICALCYRFSGNPMWVIALTGSVAAGNADSWASEIGSFSKSTPFSIIRFKPLQKGISGGITVLGTAAGFAGALFIAVISFKTIQLIDPVDLSTGPAIVSVTFAGFAGMLCDSVIGALFQALYKNRAGETTEIAGGNTLIKGYRVVNNDMVNFLSTLFGGFAAFVTYIFIR